MYKYQNTNTNTGQKSHFPRRGHLLRGCCRTTVKCVWGKYRKSKVHVYGYSCNAMLDLCSKTLSQALYVFSTGPAGDFNNGEGGRVPLSQFDEAYRGSMFFNDLQNSAIYIYVYILQYHAIWQFHWAIDAIFSRVKQGHLHSVIQSSLVLQGWPKSTNELCCKSVELQKVSRLRTASIDPGRVGRVWSPTVC